MLHTLLHDVRRALRLFSRERAFSIVSLVTLALGIGAVTAIFSVVNAVLLKDPPYPQPGRIVALSSLAGGVNDGQTFHYLRERCHAFDVVAARSGSAGWNLVSGDHVEYATGLPVSQHFFAALGVRPLVGREFTEAEDTANGPRAAILSEPLWRRVFNGRAEAIGATVLLGGVPHTVVGVMSAGFQSIPAADVWTPLRVSPRDNSWNYTVIARLRDGVTIARANSELEGLRVQLGRDLRGISEERSRSLAWISYRDILGVENRRPVLLLTAAVAFLLLVACVNVASLQLARSLARRREMATRTALGGSRRALVRDVLVESVALALCGGGAGVFVARAGIAAMAAVVPEGLLPTQGIDVDARVLLVTVAVSFAVGIVFGLAPAIAATRVDIRTALWEGGRETGSRRTMRLRRAFIVVEMALAVVLLVASGLLIRTFANLAHVELGFDPDNVVVGKMSLQGTSRQAGSAAPLFMKQTLERIRQQPGVLFAEVGSNVPVERALNLALEPPPDALVHEPRAVDWRYVTPGYFDLLKARIRAGRNFTDSDNDTGAPVVIVNQAFVRTYYGHQPVVGRRLRLMKGTRDPEREIVGVVTDMKNLSGTGWTRGINGLASPAAPALYVPLAQVPESLLDLIHHFFPVSWVVKTAGPMPAITRTVETQVHAGEPLVPFIGFKTMREIIAKDVQTQRFMMILLGVFASVALLLAAVGTYGLVAYSVNQRTREIAIRVAVGATRPRVVGAFLRESVVLAAIGAALGLALAAVATRVLASMIFGVTTRDAFTFAGGAAVLLATSLAAAVLPALRAARVDPASALRAE